MRWDIFNVLRLVMPAAERDWEPVDVAVEDEVAAEALAEASAEAETEAEAEVDFDSGFDVVFGFDDALADASLSLSLPLRDCEVVCRSRWQTHIYIYDNVDPTSPSPPLLHDLLLLSA